MLPERLSSLDASFLYLERPSMHMHVAGLSILAPRQDGPLRYEHVQAVVQARLSMAPRLRQRVLRVPFGLARPLWVDDPGFDLDFHLRRSAVPEPGGRLQLERAVGRILSRPLDPSKPLWELYVFEGLEHDRTAVLLKLHHALADGIGSMLIASALFDLDVEAPTDAGEGQPWEPSPPPTSADLIREATEDLVLHPLRAMGRAVEAPSLAWSDLTQIVAGIRHLAGMGTPPRGPFDVDVGPARRFATAEAPFARIRDVKNALGGTVNDVVLAAVAGGLHALLTARGEPTRGRSLRIMIPVSVRSRSEAAEVGNRVAPAFVDVPVGKMAPTTRLKRIRQATRALKESGVALSADSIIGLGAYAPPSLHATAARLVSRARWFNLVVSNIPAPQVPLYLAGARLLRSYPAMPLGENCALSVACTSLGGSMAFGLTADWDALKDLDVLARGIEAAIDDLAAAAGLD
jgi:diacylglycerol O-acyltransferase